MTVTDKNVIRFHLEVFYGISVRNVVKKRDRLFVSGTKIFGVPLENLPRCYIPEFGLVPCFLVDACAFLLERAGTVGLFRKPGSLPRIKTLRDKLNRGEACVSAAPPYDVATLIKQFCRELPEPLIPCELHGALLQAQVLPNPQDRAAALQLLSCLLLARSSSCLHYLFDFLAKTSQRCTENLMTSSNLAMIFAPCLLPPPNKSEMSEGRLELRVLVLRTFIENPHLFGVIPKTVKNSLEYLTFQYPDEDHFTRGQRKKCYFKGLRSVMTVSWIQGRLKARTLERGLGSTSDRPTLRRSLGLETFPNITLFRTSPDWGLDRSATTLSPADKESCKTSRGRLKRGQTEDNSPVQPAVGKFHLWGRRISL